MKDMTPKQILAAIQWSMEETWRQIDRREGAKPRAPSAKTKARGAQAQEAGTGGKTGIR